MFTVDVKQQSNNQTFWSYDNTEIFSVRAHASDVKANYCYPIRLFQWKSRKENPQKLTQLSPRSQSRHLVGKRAAQKDAIKDITSDSQVSSYFSYRWSPASLTINIYFYFFLYLYITRITINNGSPHLKKSLKSQNRRADMFLLNLFLILKLFFTKLLLVSTVKCRNGPVGTYCENISWKRFRNNRRGVNL